MEEPAAARSILVIESSADHVQRIEQALQQSAVQHRLTVLTDGEQAMQFLRGQGRFAEAARPDLILLDLNLSGMDGRELLSDLKADPQLKRIPVIVLTLSDRPEDIFQSYAQQGNCYVIKPTDLDQLTQIVRRIEAFWLEIVTLPKE